jgi:hypothetical protein
LINNRQGNRRRGRGGGGSGNAPRQNTGNNSRIDNRARGNAHQLHEKYKVLARDAQMGGDRVMMEYYYQFADHYFRILNENKARWEQHNQRRDYAGDGDDAGEFDEAGAEANEAESEAEPRRERNDRYERNDRNERNGQRGRYERNERGPQRYDSRRDSYDEQAGDDRQAEATEAGDARFAGQQPAPLPLDYPVAAQDTAPRRRGRPARAQTDTNDEPAQPDFLSHSAQAAAQIADSEAASPPRRRGRPPKAQIEAAAE